MRRLKLDRSTLRTLQEAGLGAVRGGMQNWTTSLGCTYHPCPVVNAEPVEPDAGLGVGRPTTGSGPPPEAV